MSGEKCASCGHGAMSHEEMGCWGNAANDRPSCQCDLYRTREQMDRTQQAAALERIATALEILAWIEGQQHGIYRSPGALAYLAARMDALEPAAPPAPPTPGGGGDA